MSSKITNDLGNVEVSEEVIANIAGSAVTECFGVIGMASRKISDGIAELLGKDSLNKGIEVKIFEDRLEIDIYIIVVYGVKISEVAKNVMEKVSYQVTKITGLEIGSVNVIVQGVRILDKVGR